METVMSNGAVAAPTPESAYAFMLTSLSQFQAQGWKKWLSPGSDLLGGTDCL